MQHAGSVFRLRFVASGVPTDSCLVVRKMDYQDVHQSKGLSSSRLADVHHQRIHFSNQDIVCCSRSLGGW